MANNIYKKIKELEKRVDRGIKWLDKNKKNWTKKIDLQVLNLSSNENCIVGQLFDDYFEGFVNDTMTKTESVKHGFLLSSVREKVYYDILTHIWFCRVNELRK